MSTRTMTVTGALALVLALASASESLAQHRTSTLTTRTGATVTKSVDADRTDGRVGVQRTVSGPNGKVASATRSTTAQDGAIVHYREATGFNGRTKSRQGIYTHNSSSHTRMGRLGRTRTWTREW
jgi:hypothetical protein